jgi:hypothetical protein
MIKYVKDIDNNILDIPELKQLRTDQNSLSMSMFSEVSFEVPSGPLHFSN